MKRSSLLNPGLRVRISLAVVATMTCAASVGSVSAADTKAAEPKAAAATTEKKSVVKKLTGAELYAIHCNRCHAERYPTEFASAQWKTLMTHMRVRANLPAAQAKTILKYLQEDSGT